MNLTRIQEQRLRDQASIAAPHLTDLQWSQVERHGELGQPVMVMGPNDEHDEPTYIYHGPARIMLEHLDAVWRRLSPQQRDLLARATMTGGSDTELYVARGGGEIRTARALMDRKLLGFGASACVGVPYGRALLRRAGVTTSQGDAWVEIFHAILHCTCGAKTDYTRSHQPFFANLHHKCMGCGKVWETPAAADCTKAAPGAEAPDDFGELVQQGDSP